MHDVVIGNAWGDEGKGLVTDWLAGPGSVVVRFCGGAQAGHTVVTPDGRRHVFHHFGSGTFKGAATFLSRFFYCDPMAFNHELKALHALGVTPPTVLVSPAAAVVTPYDRLLNQLTEAARGDERHGSCGHGIGEAARRAESREVRRATHLSYGALRLAWAHGDLLPGLYAQLDRIEAELRQQLAVRGITGSADALAADIVRARIRFVGSLSRFLAHTEPFEFHDPRRGRLVFEGSQGLLLDRDLGVFPYVTRAKTGLVNVEEILGTLEDTRVWFVSRSYFTRHGAGPLPGEDPELRYGDDTNVPNDWQGRMRFAPRSEEVLEDARTRALAEVSTQPAEVRTFVSWTDVPGTEGLRTDGWSYGPTREHCHEAS